MDHSTIARLHIVEMLEAMLAGRRVVLIARIIDENGKPEYSASASGQSNSSATAGTLEGAIERLTDHPRMKICARPDCFWKGEPIHIDLFGVSKDSADGHQSFCKKCEAKRIGGVTKRRKRGPDGP